MSIFWFTVVEQHQESRIFPAWRTVPPPWEYPRGNYVPVWITGLPSPSSTWDRTAACSPCDTRPHHSATSPSWPPASWAHNWCRPWNPAATCMPTRSTECNLKRNERLERFCRINKQWEVIARTIDITHWTQAHNNRPKSPTITPSGGVYVPCIYRMPGGVIVGNSGLCCCGPAFNVWH